MRLGAEEERRCVAACDGRNSFWRRAEYKGAAVFGCNTLPADAHIACFKNGI
jgi:2-polyprenyl-6-methoxyphenol hydroxylase-like FAD-dependent oxidoreductase